MTEKLAKLSNIYKYAYLTPCTIFMQLVHLNTSAMNTEEIVSYIKLKLRNTQGSAGQPNIGLVDLLTDLRTQIGDTGYFKIQDAIQLMEKNGLVANREKGVIFFNEGVLT